MDKKKIAVIGILIVVSLAVIIMVVCGAKKNKAEQPTLDENISGEQEINESSSKEKNTSIKCESSATNDESGESDNSSTSTDNTEADTTTDTETSSVIAQSSSNEEGGKQSNTEETTTKNNIAETETTAQNVNNSDDKAHSPQPVRNMTTAQIVKDMGIGINLGNTFESCGDWINSSLVKNYETAWGSPVITKQMIEGMAAEGFKTLRIPVAWSNMMAADYTINPKYMARVKEVTDWAIDSGMYVILNIHWDGGWWTNFPTRKAECMKKYKSIWTQISKEFCDYGDKLIFESLNEEGCWDSIWNHYGGATANKKKAYDLLNEINQTFVDIVRGSGCNNAKRHLLIAGYATDITLTCDSYFKMPTDAVGRCAVSVHYYTPSTYTILEEDEDWGKAKTEWGNAGDVAELNKYMKMMYDKFTGKGVPVIIGEFGLPAMANKTKENAILYLSSVAKAAYDYGMCPVLWDTTSNYSYYNRYTCSMSAYQELKQAFLNIVK